MGDPAVALPPTAAPAATTPPPTAAPAASPPSPPASAAPAPPAAATPPGSGAPTPAPGSPAGDDLPTRPSTIDINKWREERGRYTRQITELQKQAQAAKTYEQQLAEARQKLETSQRAAGHFDALSRVIRSNPELAKQIEELIGEFPDDAAAARTPAPVALPPEALAGLTAMQRLEARALAAEKAAKEREARIEFESTQKELRDSFRPVLEKRRMPIDVFTPLLEPYILYRLNKMGEDATFEEVPYLMAEFVKPILDWHNAELTRMREGKTEDARLPATPEGTPPIHPAAPTHANDATTNRMAEDFLRSRGWQG